MRLPVLSGLIRTGRDCPEVQTWPPRVTTVFVTQRSIEAKTCSQREDRYRVHGTDEFQKLRGRSNTTTTPYSDTHVLATTGKGENRERDIHQM